MGLFDEVVFEGADTALAMCRLGHPQDCVFQTKDFDEPYLNVYVVRDGHFWLRDRHDFRVLTPVNFTGAVDASWGTCRQCERIKGAVPEVHVTLHLDGGKVVSVDCFRQTLEELAAAREVEAAEARYYATPEGRAKMEAAMRTFNESLKAAWADSIEDLVYKDRPLAALLKGP